MVTFAILKLFSIASHTKYIDIISAEFTGKAAEAQSSLWSYPGPHSSVKTEAQVLWLLSGPDIFFAPSHFPLSKQEF